MARICVAEDGTAFQRPDARRLFVAGPVRAWHQRDGGAFPTNQFYENRELWYVNVGWRGAQRWVPLTRYNDLHWRDDSRYPLINVAQLAAWEREALVKRPKGGPILPGDASWWLAVTVLSAAAVAGLFWLTAYCLISLGWR